MWHGEYRDPRLVEVSDAERIWGWEHDFFMRVLADRVTPRVLDLGCGTGRLAVAMAADGHEVTAVDPAPASLAAARRRSGAARVRWIEGSYEVLPAQSFDAAFMTGHVVQHLSDQEWTGALKALRDALVTDGRLIFDGQDPSGRPWAHWGRESTERPIVLADGSTVWAWTERSEPDGDVVPVAHHYRFEDGLELTSTATLRFRDETELRGALRAAGFRVDQVYGGWSREPPGLGPDGELIVIAVAEPRMLP
ncbi:class I SAM-dependent methyltransferase [Actinoplanes sp. G11-F43]|uniref:class I SAM-dependent methyltransferase n=1 Tax=Actinoplanes sp. G11-F43 TaxID=3424130 RepID=UPI003D329A66